MSAVIVDNSVLMIQAHNTELISKTPKIVFFLSKSFTQYCLKGEVNFLFTQKTNRRKLINMYLGH